MIPDVLYIENCTCILNSESPPKIEDQRKKSGFDALHVTKECGKLNNLLCTNLCNVQKLLAVNEP